MSAVYFESKGQGAIELRGSERAYMMGVQFDYAQRAGHSSMKLPNGSQGLNEAIAVGSDTLTLLMRIHAQCEAHGWIDGPNRQWAADLIDKGRTEGLYREGMGWEALAAFLRFREDEPVFMSYSVCERFPSYQAVRGYISLDEWQCLPYSEKWRLAEQALRLESQEEQANADAPFSRELRPDHWADYFFG